MEKVNEVDEIAWWWKLNIKKSNLLWFKYEVTRILNNKNRLIREVVLIFLPCHMKIHQLGFILFEYFFEILLKKPLIKNHYIILAA